MSQLLGNSPSWSKERKERKNSPKFSDGIGSGRNINMHGGRGKNATPATLSPGIEVRLGIGQKRAFSVRYSKRTCERDLTIVIRGTESAGSLTSLMITKFESPDPT